MTEQIKSPDIIFEDQQLIVLNKPAGMVTHPGINHPDNTLMNWLLDQGVTLSSPEGYEERRGVVHRLDKWTEGLILFAKQNEAHQHLATQFKERQVEKTYLAMVYGDLDEEECIIDKAIGRDRSNRIKRSVMHMIPGSEKEAITTVRTLKRYNTKTLVEAKPKTGRMHQIRVHLASIGHPIIGDPLYLPKSKAGNGQLLQAQKLSITHPESQERMHFELPPSHRLIKPKK